MLVDINLLPQKEPKRYSFIITLSSLLVMLLLIGGFYFWKTQTIKDEIASLDRQISVTQKIVEKENQNSKIVASAGSVNQLKTAIQWANDYSVQTVPVMQHLTSLLPERGFILSFGYTETGAVSLYVQFDNAREAAYFLDSLNHSKWVEEASLTSLSAKQSKTETNATNNEVALNSQENTTSPTTSPTDQKNTDINSSINNQNNTVTDSTSNQNTSANTNTTNTAINQNIENNTTESSDITVNNILPRYTGQFEIKFDKEAIKKVLKESKQYEGGVKGS
ncbi:hypothetical protein [Neobacillus drentensis]|uniref:hypothetical protein n=1 Tax=Neobacillus drentensis TaxID=220684 RepID=UPI0030036E19